MTRTPAHPHAAALAGIATVSRETLERLEVYAALLLKWTRAINLIGKATGEQVWTRHIADSLQLWPLKPENASTWIDLGSGGGLPGLVIAACDPDLAVTLVEADQRKAEFLRTAAREMGLSTTVLDRRIEEIPPSPHDVVSARALAPLARLLALAHPFHAKGGIALFPKGRMADSELTEAKASWHISGDALPSRTDPAGRILCLQEFEPLP